MTSLNEIGLFIIIVLNLLIILLPRRYAFLPLFFAICYLTNGQNIIISNVNIYPVRALIISGFVGLIFRYDIPIFRWDKASLRINHIDALVVSWAILGFLIYLIREPNMTVLIYRIGYVFDVLGLYFLCRCLIRDLDDIRTVTVFASICIVPLAIFMLAESLLKINAYAILGGVNEVSMTRDGYIRSQGPFRHPILAGSFGAALIPLFVAIWWKKNGKFFSGLGFIFATLIVMTTMSSGPLLSYAGALIGLSLWPIRDHLGKVRWLIVLSLILLQVVMSAPFYYIIDRISQVTGGSGWYRSYLIHQAINRFGEWWLIGTTDTSGWMPFAIPGRAAFADITNQYIAEGLNGGLITMILFILIIVYCFKSIGKEIQSTVTDYFPDKILMWGLGVSLAVHVISFFSVGYFDQIIVIWYFTLASISSLRLPIKSDSQLGQVGGP
jgi:hypothetical protein